MDHVSLLTTIHSAPAATRWGLLHLLDEIQLQDGLNGTQIIRMGRLHARQTARDVTDFRVGL